MIGQAARRRDARRCDARSKHQPRSSAEDKAKELFAPPLSAAFGARADVTETLVRGLGLS
jgi:hypothetical protein